MKAPYKMTIKEASNLIFEKKLTPLRLLESLLDRIEKLDPSIEAWETVNNKSALLKAEKLTKLAAK